MKPIIRKIVVYVKGDYHADRQANSETEDIDGRKSLLSHNIPQSYFNKIFYHISLPHESIHILMY